MEHIGARKARTLIDAQVVTTATATPYPAFPTGPTSGVVAFAGDFQNARIYGFKWDGTFSNFTAADLTLQHSDDGVTWYTLKAATQVVSSPFSQYVPLLDTDPAPMRFIRGLVDMTGTPGTSTHTVVVEYEQVGSRGCYAPPGVADRTN